MTKRIASVLLIVVGTGIVFAGEQTKEEFSLRLRLKPGTVFRVKSCMLSAVKQMVARKNMDMESKTEKEFCLKVMTADDKGAVVEATCNRVILHSKEQGTEEISYDSDHPEGEPPENDAEVVALVGKTFLLRIDPMGGVTRKAQADDAEPDEAVQVLCNMISGIFKYVPEKPVAIGGKWTRSEDAEGKIRIRGTNTFTFAECSGGTLLISLRGTISGKSERSAKAQHEVKGTSEGTMKLDEETRFPLESTMKQNMTIHNAVDDIHWTARAQNLVELSVTIESVSSATPGR
ncbi:MAG TPA: DUF6263 family protein [Planctomycetota bacterium]|nr:DUF6263 family protein [Planctomycetota bacterium]